MKKIILFFILLWSINCFAQGTWHNLGAGITCDTNIGGTCYPFVLATCADTINDVLYVGGEFNTAGNIKQFAISKWDGSKWDSLPNIGFSDVGALIMYHDSLYVGSKNGGVVYRFNGSAWTSLPRFYEAVYCFGIYKDTLYAGGEFSKSGSTAINNIAKWDGTEWLPLRGGVSGGAPDEVNAMTVYHDTLFVGGFFTTADTMPAYSIAKWDGANWSAVGDNGVTFWTSGLNRSPAYVSAFETFQDNLYVGGCYDSVGGMAIGYTLADWNGTKWDSMPHPDSEQYQECDGHGALKSFDGYLFIYGGSEYISKWNGITVSSVDSGLNEQITTLATLNGSLYVGGEFDTAGKTIPANSIATWTPDSTATTVKQLSINNNHLTISPNPFSQQATLQFSQPINGNAQLTLFDLIGRQVENYTISSGAKNLIIKRNDLPVGMYFYKVSGSGMPPLAGKVVIE